MSIPLTFKFDPDVKYRTGGVFETTHQFSLVNQSIQVNKHSSFKAKFPNIWTNYKLPKITDSKSYNNWISNPMQFWQNQLNFAVWCATTGCGVSKYNHLKHKDPMIRSVFRFHAYYQIRRILSEMQCPLPNENSWNALNNGIDMSAFERICSEFGISTHANFRQKLDYSNGMGTPFYYAIHWTRGFVGTKKKVLEKSTNYDPKQNWTVYVPPHKFGNVNAHNNKIEYIEQFFHKQSDTVDTSSDGKGMSAIGSFVLDYGKGFTQEGVSRINDSIRTYVWAILGAQSQARSSILGTGKAFDAQKQFLANVEDAINSEIDLPSSVERYQSTLQYAMSKVDFVIGEGLYMMPSDMDLYIGTINGYNNKIVIASDNLKMGQNNDINDDIPVPQLESAPVQQDDFDDTQDVLPPQQDDSQDKMEPPQDSPKKLDLTNDERKLGIILALALLGPAAFWALK